MWCRVWVRCASRTSFQLPPIKFRHRQLPALSEDMPLITSPITPGHKGKQEHREGWQRSTDRSQRRGKAHHLKPQQPHFKSSAVTLEKDANVRDGNFPERPKGKNRSKFAAKSMNRSPEENLKHLGIDVSGEIIHGIFPVLLALQAKRRKLHKVIYKSGSGPVSENMQNILNIAREKGIAVTDLKAAQFKRIFQGDQVHQGVCCDVSPLPLVTLGEEEHLREECREGNTRQEAEEERRRLWLFLDQIHDPMNFGSLLRSAYFLGISRVIVSESCSVGISSTVSKASAGVAEFFPVHRAKDTLKLLAALTQAGWQVVSSASPGGGSDDSALTDVTRFHPEGSVLLIVGNEGKGISPEVQQMCHAVLTVEPGRSLHPHLQCLNVSVATALLLHSLRQRLAPCST